MLHSFQNCCDGSTGGASDSESRTGESDMSVDIPSSAFTETRFFAEKNIHDIPVDKINGLSAEERAEAFYDLHGVQEAMVQETPDLIAEKFDALDLEMFLVEDKTAFDLAREENDEYVKSMRLAFLRAENFDVPAAALRMARHFEFRLRMFGKGVLARDIALSDLPETDRTLLEVGFMQLGLERDRVGRAIEIQMMRQLGREPPAESAARLFFYLMCILGSQELTQKKGVILMEYMVGIKIEQLLGTNRRARNPLFLNVMASMPVRLAALHVCFDDPRIRALFKLLTSVIEGKLLCRLQSHFGTDLECLYSLMAFGISPSCLPVQSDGSIDTSNHRRLMSELAEMDPVSGSTTYAVPVLEDEHEASPPTAEDVLMGRGKHGKKWPGNLRLRRLVEGHKDAYKASDREGKIAISQALYKEIIDSGSRFLVPAKGSSKLDGGWVEMPRSEVCLRIAHLFRNLRAADRSSSVSTGGHSR